MPIQDAEPPVRRARGLGPVTTGKVPAAVGRRPTVLTGANMRNGFLTSILTVLLGVGPVWCQSEGASRAESAGEPADGWSTTRLTGAQSPTAQKGDSELPKGNAATPATPSTLPPTGPVPCDATP